MVKLMKVELVKPGRIGVMMAFAFALAMAGVGQVIKLSAGGSLANVAGLAAGGLATGLLAECGASYSRGGWRGLLISIAGASLAYGVITALATYFGT